MHLGALPRGATAPLPCMPPQQAAALMAAAAAALAAQQTSRGTSGVPGSVQGGATATGFNNQGHDANAPPLVSIPPSGVQPQGVPNAVGAIPGNAGTGGRGAGTSNGAASAPTADNESEEAESDDGDAKGPRKRTAKVSTHARLEGKMRLCMGDRIGEYRIILGDALSLLCCFPHHRIVRTYLFSGQGHGGVR